MALLELEGLSARYGQIEVLHAVALSVERGEIVTLIGANGAGKSTLLRAISGLVERSGTLRFDGHSLGEQPAHRIPALGVAHVPEGRNIFANLTVLENLRLGHLAAAGRADRQAQLAAVFDLFPALASRRHQLGGTLSGGEQQMLAMGRAMMSAPTLLLLDEPSLGLAPIVVDRVFDLVRDLNAHGATVLLVEQNAYRALQIAHRAYVLEGGRIALSGQAQALARDPSVQRFYLGG
jgi:branched-chain amino acid transport system ATP-binding protein